MGNGNLESIRAELRSIISELDSISNGVRADFKGIGNEKCAKRLDQVIEQYKKALTKLNNVNTSKIDTDWLAAHTDGGGGIR